MLDTFEKDDVTLDSEQELADAESADMELAGQEASSEAEEQKKRSIRRGLYGKLKISVKTLDMIIVACIAVIILTFLFNLNDLGFDVSFETNGGTQIETITQMYGSKIDESLVPTREGYEFVGWYLDEACQFPWNIEEDTIKEDFTLYAKWKEITE